MQAEETAYTTTQRHENAPCVGTLQVFSMVRACGKACGGGKVRLEGAQGTDHGEIWDLSIHSLININWIPTVL